MNIKTVIHLSNEIDRLESALKWLTEHRRQLDGKDTFSIAIRLNSCIALFGAKEAERHLSDIAQLHIQEIIDHAMRDAVNTIEIHRDVIHRESQ